MSLQENVQAIISAVTAAANKIRSLSGYQNPIRVEDLANAIQDVYDSKTPTLQNKNVALTLDPQTVTADSGYDALDKVNVGGINEYWEGEKFVIPNNDAQYITPTPPKLCIGAVIVNPVPDETKTVTITQEGTTVINPSAGKWLSQVTVNVHPVEPKDYNFFDWDDTLLYSYTVAELNALTELPAMPTHEGVTAYKWNYTLAQLKSLTTHAPPLPCNVGAIYSAPDNISMLLWITIPENDTKRDVDFSIRMGSSESAVVDWGDGSNTETLYTNSSNIISQQHTYSASGDYKITITPGYNCKFSLGSTTPILGAKARQMSYLRKVVLGRSDANIGSGGTSTVFALHPNLEILSFGRVEPSEYTHRNFLQGCNSLKAIHFPVSIDHITAYAAPNCGVRVVTIPYNVYYIDFNCFTGCTNLTYLTLPASLTSVNVRPFGGSGIKRLVFPNNTYGGSSPLEQACAYMNALEEIVLPTTISTFPSSFMALYSHANYVGNTISYMYFPPSITSLASNAMSGRTNGSLRVADFRNHTTVPTLSNANAIYATKYIVPDDLYSTWITATNWVDKAANIMKASEYVD